MLVSVLMGCSAHVHGTDGFSARLTEGGRMTESGESASDACIDELLHVQDRPAKGLDTVGSVYLPLIKVNGRRLDLYHLWKMCLSVGR